MAATEQTSIGICLVDEELRYSWVNGAFCSLLGYSSEELIGRSPFEFTHPDDVDLGKELIDKAFDGDIPFFHTRKRYIRPDGTIVVGDLLSTALFEDDAPIGGLAILVDASQTDPTTHRIESLQRSAAIGQITASAVHDLRNNIGAIGLVGDALEAQHGLLPAIELLKYEVEGTMQLLSAITSYVHPATRQREFESIGEVFAQANPLLRLVVPATTALDIVLIDPELTPTIESRELQQVITNLLLNARDATNTIGGRISISAGLTDGQPGCLDIVVSDNGCGMTASEFENAFDPYFTTKGENGTGLGLTICRDIIERNGGRLLAESTKGIGSLFTIRLPLCAVTDDEQTARSSADDQPSVNDDVDTEEE